MNLSCKNSREAVRDKTQPISYQTKEKDLSIKPKNKLDRTVCISE
jgi:hypothetical protein